MSNSVKDLEKAIRESVRIGPDKPKTAMDSLVDIIDSEISEFCPKCHDEVYPWYRFCVICGTSISIFDESQESPTALQDADCQNDHKDTYHEEAFCSYCGKEILDPISN